MIRIAFLLNFPLEYKGGINYFKNLFYAISKVNEKEFRIVLFVPENIPDEYVNLFSPYVEIIKTSIIRRKSFSWFIDKVLQKLFRYGPLTEFLLTKNNINILSHSNYVSRNKKIKSINWIPDFQYLHYPELWPAKQLPKTKELHTNLAKHSDVIVLSSNDAFKDYKTLYPSLSEKVRVLHFVSQPSFSSPNLNEHTLTIEKYSGSKPFFYLPNQFWFHKNHILAFKAVKILKDKGYDFVLLTSGVMEDYRSKNGHVSFLKNYVEENDLLEMVKFLGVIPYADVLLLAKSSKAVINPSLFEGWSSTVEEARTLGANLLLSNIAVHREQNPANAEYFNTDKENELAHYMEEHLKRDNVMADNSVSLQNSLDQRTLAFGNTYLNIIKELI